MTIPNLKRIKVSTPQDLHRWLARTDQPEDEVLIVTCGKKSAAKHIPSADVREALSAHGWVAGRSYTMTGNLLGHVARRA